MTARTTTIQSLRCLVAISFRHASSSPLSSFRWQFVSLSSSFDDWATYIPHFPVFYGTLPPSSSLLWWGLIFSTNLLRRYSFECSGTTLQRVIFIKTGLGCWALKRREDDNIHGFSPHTMRNIFVRLMLAAHDYFYKSNVIMIERTKNTKTGQSK